MSNPKHPFLYEINTRSWLNRFITKSGKPGLKDVPGTYWDYLKEMGMDYIWLMGIWKTNEKEFDRFRLDDRTVKSYRKSLPDFRYDDVIGSPYAVDEYSINSQIGSLNELLSVKSQLNTKGLKLILDFVPNHFGRHTRYLTNNPEYFLKGSKHHIREFPDYFFRRENEPEQIFAHGRDPYFGSWVDTVQVDYSNPASRQFLKEQLLNVAKHCDGVRCDMAMMQLKSIFKDSWHFLYPEMDLSGWDQEFWTDCIRSVKSGHPEFLFIAEVYWNKEEELHRQGFDFCYDKVLTDRLKFGNSYELKTHISGRMDFHNQCVHFLENHDEQRSLKELGVEKNQAAVALSIALPGMRLFHEGQWEGKRLHCSVHLSRSYAEELCPCHLQNLLDFNERYLYFSINQELMFHYSIGKNSYPEKRFPIEAVCKCTYTFFDQFLRAMNQPVFKAGECRFLDFVSGPETDEYVDGIFGFEWKHEDQIKYILINYSHHTCTVNIPLPARTGIVAPDLYDEFNQMTIGRKSGNNPEGFVGIPMIPYGIRIVSFVK